MAAKFDTKVPENLKKWTLKLKIAFIRDYLGERDYNVINHHHSIEWVGKHESSAGSVSMKFLQDMGELNFDEKIITYFNLVTDTDKEKETATQREKKIRDNLYHYANNKAAFPKNVDESKKQTSKKAAK
ncbi:MAG: hypothetical protein HRS57_00450 [Mycoplasmataceae bacterium]|nr:hypothetical protein [Mycoplasmataceae bacterium]